SPAKRSDARGIGGGGSTALSKARNRSAAANRRSKISPAGVGGDQRSGSIACASAPLDALDVSVPAPSARVGARGRASYRRGDRAGVAAASRAGLLHGDARGPGDELERNLAAGAPRRAGRKSWMGARPDAGDHISFRVR